MSDSSTFAPDPSDPSGAMFPVVRKNGFDPSHVLAWVKDANRKLSELHDENDALQSRIDRLERMLASELDEDTLVTTLGEETVRVLLAARQSANAIKERAEADARQRMEEADEYAHRISTSAEHAVASMTKEAEDRAATAREEATRAVARIHSEAAKARTEADAHARQVRAEADEMLRAAKEEAEQTIVRAAAEAAEVLRKAKEESEHALDRAEEDAAAVRRAATADANELRTTAEREARVLAQQFQQERATLLAELRASCEQVNRNLALLDEKRETLAAVVLAANELHAVSASLADGLQALDVSVVGDDELTAFEEDLGTAGLEEDDDWYARRDARTAAPTEDLAETDEDVEGADGVELDETEDVDEDELDDYADDGDDEYEDDYDEAEDEFDDDFDDEFDDDYDDYDELDADDADDDVDEDVDENGVDGLGHDDVPPRPANGTDAGPGEDDPQLGVAPWWKKRAAG